MGKKKAEVKTQTVAQKKVENETRELDQMQLLVKNLKTLIIDDKALFRDDKGKPPKIVVDAFNALGDISGIFMMTSDRISCEKFFAENFMVEKEIDIPVYKSQNGPDGKPILEADGKPRQFRNIEKKLTTFQDIQPRYAAIRDTTTKMRYIDTMRETSSHDIWVIVTDKQLIAKYYGVSEYFMVPNQEHEKTQTGMKFKIFLVEKANDWRDIINIDASDKVIAVGKESGPDDIEKDEVVDEKQEDIIPDKI